MLWLFFTVAFSVLAFIMLKLLGKSRLKITCPEAYNRSTKKMFWCFLVLLVLLWLPYLLYYYPGFVFPDTDVSMRQALGEMNWNNHHPVIYTLFIRGCLWAGGALSSGDITKACAVYSVIQMVLMAAAFSFLLCWCYTRFSLRSKWWGVGFLLVYGLNPYVAADSIAMWKDPLFSAAIMIWSLLLCDLGLTSGKIFESRKWRASFFIIALVILFWRNNGFCVVAAGAGLLFILCVLKRIDWRVFLLSLASVMVWLVVTIPGYRILGIGTPKEEVSGVMLNQVARVVVYDGNMTDEDRDYLNELMPLEHYSEAYRPCCVDLLKWDDQFNASALAGSRFLKTWFSLLVRNPRLYFEAWELETYGYWSVNRVEINLNEINISAGAPFNNREVDSVSIGSSTLHFSRNLKGTIWPEILKKDFWSPPLGILTWLILFGLLYALLYRKEELLLLMFPSFGGMMGLILASPIYYLARYGAFAQFLLPVFLLTLAARKTTLLREPD